MSGIRKKRPASGPGKARSVNQQETTQLQQAETAPAETPASETFARPRAGIGRAGRAMLAFAFLIPFVWLGALRICVMKTGENSQDALYHAMMAKLGPGDRKSVV